MYLIFQLIKSFSEEGHLNTACSVSCIQGIPSLENILNTTGDKLNQKIHCASPYQKLFKVPIVIRKHSELKPTTGHVPVGFVLSASENYYK